jgi:hypothetical protein
MSAGRPPGRSSGNDGAAVHPVRARQDVPLECGAESGEELPDARVAIAAGSHQGDVLIWVKDIFDLPLNLIDRVRFYGELICLPIQAMSQFKPHVHSKRFLQPSRDRSEACAANWIAYSTISTVAFWASHFAVRPHRPLCLVEATWSQCIPVRGFCRSLSWWRR